MQKILIISLKHLGDLVTTTAVLPLLKKAWDKAEIHYLVNPEAISFGDYGSHHRAQR
jgi:ADP-heptose:LPS heptosyltransferase